MLEPEEDPGEEDEDGEQQGEGGGPLQEDGDGGDGGGGGRRGGRGKRQRGRRWSLGDWLGLESDADPSSVGHAGFEPRG